MSSQLKLLPYYPGALGEKSLHSNINGSIARPGILAHLNSIKITSASVFLTVRMIRSFTFSLHELNILTTQIWAPVPQILPARSLELSPDAPGSL